MPIIAVQHGGCEAEIGFGFTHFGSLARVRQRRAVTKETGAAET